MAKKQDSLDLALSCGICMEEFAVDGDHIPRLLPCTHTLCETCLKQLIQNKKLQCPECMTKHEVTRAEKTFPQNKYLLTQIRRLQYDTKKVQYEYERCAEHRKELILFCNEQECQKAICTTCLKTSHKKHDVTEIEDEKKEIIMKSIQSFKTNLQMKIRKISGAKENVEKEADICIKKLTKEKDEFCKKFDKRIEESKRKVEEVRTLVKDELSAMNETLIVLNDMKESIEKGVENKYEDIMGKMDTIKGIEDNINMHLSGKREYVYHEYISEIEIGRMVREKRMVVELVDNGRDSADNTSSDTDDSLEVSAVEIGLGLPTSSVRVAQSGTQINQAADIRLVPTSSLRVAQSGTQINQAADIRLVPTSSLRVAQSGTQINQAAEFRPVPTSSVRVAQSGTQINQAAEIGLGLPTSSVRVAQSGTQINQAAGSISGSQNSQAAASRRREAD